MPTGNEGNTVSTGANRAGFPTGNSVYQEQANQNQALSINNRLSNIGGDNPAKTFPLPRTLFYDGALLDPGVKEAEKYGLFMFYSFGSGQTNYLDQYYLSERPEYNRKISSAESKNPTAFKLVQDTIEYSSLIGGGSNSTSTNGSPIIGKTSAPYYLKDFIYCKYYGTIPNNRLLTLRRFAGPVLDNFSLPKGISDPASQKKGIGVPVAQAVTWFGGKSGNALSEIINFGTGLNWTEQEINPEKVQQLFGDGLLNSSLLKQLVNFANEFSSEGLASGTIGNLLLDESKVNSLDGIAIAQSPLGDELISARYYKAFRDAVKGDTDGQFGILSERIWVPVDVIEQTKKRDIGLSFTWDPISLKFTYDLTSAGEVNSKAALFDILGNLLSISSNYGNFITPYIKYDAEYSALTFPRGEEGARQYLTDLPGFLVDTKNLYLDQENDVVPTIGGGGDINKTQLEQFEKDLRDLQNALTGDGVTAELSATIGKALKAVQANLASTAATEWQAPISLYSGAPIGEWHLVVGNPYNPIAMIGNLICSGCQISFGEALGPDDFPTTIEATITLEHGRHRERGEIESIFNRGDGRFYQTVKSTTANAQTFNTVFDINGNIFDSQTGFNIFTGGEGLPFSNAPVFGEEPEV